MVHALQLHVGEGGEKLGCCEVEEVNAAGTTTKVKCSDSKWNPVLLISSYCAPHAQLYPANFFLFFFENVLNKHLMEGVSSFRSSFHDKTN